MERLQPYTRHEDARGRFVGLTNRTWAEVNFIETAAGQMRGGHYHQQTRELFFIIAGQIHIELLNVQTGVRTEFDAAPGDLFVVEPFELHTFYTRTAAQWINMLSAPMDPQHPDFHRPDSPA